MTKLVAVVGVLVFAHAVSVQTPDRPNYSGNWTLVEDRSAASPTRTLGKDFKVSQSATTVTIETTIAILSGRAGSDGVLVTDRTEQKIPTDYICDGAEHEHVLPPIPGLTGAAPTGAVVSTPPPTFYRATWMIGHLIITKHSSPARGLVSVSRLAFQPTLLWSGESNSSRTRSGAF